jgi:hypothetical protein
MIMNYTYILKQQKKLLLVKRIERVSKWMEEQEKI